MTEKNKGPQSEQNPSDGGQDAKQEEATSSSGKQDQSPLEAERSRVEGEMKSTEEKQEKAREYSRHDAMIQANSQEAIKEHAIPWWGKGWLNQFRTYQTNRRIEVNENLRADLESSIQAESAHFDQITGEFNEKMALVQGYQAKMRALEGQMGQLNDAEKAEAQEYIKYYEQLVAPLEPMVASWNEARAVAGARLEALKYQVESTNTAISKAKIGLHIIKNTGELWSFTRADNPDFKRQIGTMVYGYNKEISRLVDGVTKPDSKKPKQEISKQEDKGSKEIPEKKANETSPETAVDEGPIAPEDVSVWPKENEKQYILSVGDVEIGKVISFDRINKIKNLTGDEEWNAREALKDEVYDALAEHYEGEDLAKLEENVENALNDTFAQHN